jgi:hypothetical protein
LPRQNAQCCNTILELIHLAHHEAQARKIIREVRLEYGGPDQRAFLNSSLAASSISQLEEFFTKFAKGYCALLLAKMDATDQHDPSACWAEAMQMNMLSSVLVRLAQAAHAICLWLSGLRAKQGMLHLLAHEVRPCLIYGEFSEVGRRAVSSI